MFEKILLIFALALILLSFVVLLCKHIKCNRKMLQVAHEAEESDKRHERRMEEIRSLRDGGEAVSSTEKGE